MRFVLPILSCGLLAFAACATAPTPSAPAKAKPSVNRTTLTGSTTAVSLTKAMPASQVVILLGEPAEKKPMKTNSGTGEIWIYRRLFEQQDGFVPAGSTVVQEFGTPGPTGERAVTLRERSLFTEQYRKVDETTLILIVAGQVVEWDRTIKIGQSFTK